MWRDKLRAWWRREVFVAVPMGFDRPSMSKPGEDPRFLREMAESMRKAPVVYENMATMYRRRVEVLQAIPPTGSQAERDRATWMKEQAAIEANLLRELLSGPMNCAKALNDIANRKTEAQKNLHENWTLEGVEQ